MASFFQPAVYNPNETLSAISPSNRFLVYSNGFLPRAEILSSWYQELVLALGGAALFIPLFKVAYGSCRRGLRKRARKKLESEVKYPLPKTTNEFEPPSFSSRQSRRATGLSSAKSFGQFRQGNVAEFLDRSYDLYILPFEQCYEVDLEVRRHSKNDVSQTGLAEPSSNIPPTGISRNIWAGIDEVFFSKIESTHPSTMSVCKYLKDACAAKGISGLVIDSKFMETSTLTKFLQCLAQVGVDALLLTEASEYLNGIDLGLVRGQIFSNACIMPDGSRRDFFRAAKLRSGLAQCVRARQADADFFVGFLDLWDSSPSAAVIRRGHKFASFNGAVLSHDSATDSGTQRPQNCLSAFDLLKREDFIVAQKSWVESFKPTTANPAPGISSGRGIENLELAIPGITRILKPIPLGTFAPEPEAEDDVYMSPPDLTHAPPRPDFWNISSQGGRMCDAGCYDLREEVFQDQYLAIVSTQQHLQSLGMLEDFPEGDLFKILERLEKFLTSNPNSHHLLEKLISGLRSADTKIYRGLDSGFCLPDGHGHFWAVSREDDDGTLSLYISLKAPDFMTTIIHCFLAHFGVSRQERFDIEVEILASEGHTSRLHPRLDRELTSATYSELLFLVEQLTVTETKHPILDRVLIECERLLIEEPTRLSYIQLHSNDLLAGRASIHDVLQARLDNLSSSSLKAFPDIVGVTELYFTIERAILSALLNNDEKQLELLAAPFLEAYSGTESSFDISIDLYGLLFLSALRKHAFDEVYIETTDRCPLFLQQQDQAAVFAELWVLGSQCEIYFGIKPRALGAIIYDNYREYLNINPPPTEAWNGIDVFTAYQKVQADDEAVLIINDSNTSPAPPMKLRERLARATFLTIFCVPAMIDVCLLTFLGRGLYLTAFMTLEERIMANYAILAALVMTAGVTGWSGSTGGFYLYQSAFNNMNHFMVQSLSGGFVIAILLAICGFIAFGFEYSWYGGFIFATYLIVLSTYLNLLGIMATMHRDGAPFTSGRLVLAKCLMITFISPLLTSFVNGHDVLIYLIVLYLFLGVLLFKYSRLCQEWATWSDKIDVVKDTEIQQWEQQRAADASEKGEKSIVSEHSLKDRLGRAASFFGTARNPPAVNSLEDPSGSSDPFLQKLALGHKYIMWLLNLETDGQPLPPSYSPTWLSKAKLALASQQQINRGLKEHSPYLLFRNAKYDMAQNVGLFLVALLDRWIAISMSANGHIVNIYYNVRARYGIAFGLLYFLLCATSLDVVLQRYWGKTGRQSEEKLGNIFDFEASEKEESKIGKRRWAVAISELLWLMFSIFGIMTILLFLFVNDPNQIILYFAYIIGYSGVIMFQFNRVFTVDIKIHVQIVLSAAFCGYVLGVILHSIPASQDFHFNDVIALCCASLSAAFGTWLYTDFCDDPSREAHVMTEGSTNWKVYSQKFIGGGSENLGCRLDKGNFDILDGSQCRYADNSELADGVKKVFWDALSVMESPLYQVFPQAKEIINYTLELWSSQKLKLDIVDRQRLVDAGGGDVFAVSYRDGPMLTVILGLPSMDAWSEISEEEYFKLMSQLAAEAMLHECCEAMMLMRHADATVAELFLNSDAFISARMSLQLDWATVPELASIAVKTNIELLRHLGLGIDMNVDWEGTPEDVRRAVFARAVGQSYVRTAAVGTWLESRSTSLQHHDLYLRQCFTIYRSVLWRLELQGVSDPASVELSCPEHYWMNDALSRPKPRGSAIKNCVVAVYDFLLLFVVFVATISRGGTDCGRELWYTVSGTRFQPTIVWIILKIWKICWLIKNILVRLILLQYDPHYNQFHEWLTKGATRTLTKGLILESDPRGFRTGFVTRIAEGYHLKVYSGAHSSQPTSQDHHLARYDDEGRLCELTAIGKDISKPALSSDRWTYHFAAAGSGRKYPLYRTAQFGSREFTVHYDDYGRTKNGDCLKSDVHFRYTYTYPSKPSAESTDVLTATYVSVDLPEPTTFAVYWSRPSQTSDSGSKQSLSPSERVQRLVKTTPERIEDITWTYDHKNDPIITRTVLSQIMERSEESKPLESYSDDFGILSKPLLTSFVDEDLFFSFPLHSIQKAVSDPESVSFSTDQKHRRPRRFLGTPSPKRRITTRRRIATHKLRTYLWKEWTASKTLSAISACALDEMILRQEPSLTKYWALRDAGYLAEAKQYLENNLDDIVSAIEVQDGVSQKAPLAIKPADLFVMGLGKDSNFIISKPEHSYIDTDKRVAVIFTDTGCWPDAPGGVSNCRRDLVDGHKTVRNYALVESANEYGLPRFQTERNVQLVTNLPLWGLDGNNPKHGLFENLLQSQVERRIRGTRVQEDIVGTFIPLLSTFIRGARTRRFTEQHLRELTDVILNMNLYFENNDYLTTWRSKEVRKAWREAWLCEYWDPNISDPNDCFEIERPTTKDFECALSLYISYFFIFSVRVPEKVPRVYQSTHHGISSLYGMILKIRRGTTWAIWDHAIMMRESFLNISPAQCLLPISVQSMLIGAMKVAANLAYTHADMVVPCTAIYNPMWEADIGSDQGRRSSLKLFERKIDPITNGISNMSSFQPVTNPRTTEPTTIMLSNVQFIKDVKTAVLAAGVIINDFGFKNYNLVVYGAQDRQPSYAIETVELIENLGIKDTVKLGGFGSPKEVLKDAWLFMNSSLSEGLPLAIGEAALSGIPIVATEVGATAQVLTDADDPNIRYGEVVPPNDPVALARAQIRLLAMLGPWAKYTTDDEPPPPLPSIFTADDVTWITKRMYDKAEDRRALGLKLRDVVLRKFNGVRYLREHEQMFWIQRHMAEQRSNDCLREYKLTHPRFGEPPETRLIEYSEGDSGKTSWQHFDRKSLE